MPLARFRPGQLDRYYSHLCAEGGSEGKPLSAATVRQVHAILRRALQQGVGVGLDRLAPGRPCLSAEAPPSPEPHPKIAMSC